jgi:hypothetical protein
MFWAEEYAGESKNFLNECAERMINAADACAGHGRNGVGSPSIFQASSQDRLWRQGDIRRPEIDFRFAPESRPSRGRH